MTTQEIAQAFTDLIKAGEHEQAAAQFNSPNIVSLEAMDGPMARLEGAAAVKEKNDWWFANHEIHSMEANGPFVNGDQFCIRMGIDVTSKESGERMQMDEMCLYTVKDGKVVEERFFY